MRRKVLALIAGAACALAGLAGPSFVASGSAAAVPAPPSAAPVGALDHLSVRFDPEVRVVSGWAAAPDAPGQPTVVRVYVGAQFVGQTSTGDARPDVALAHPSFGGATGWHTTVDFGVVNPIGTDATMCAYGINPGSGPNSLLGCRPLFGSTASPYNPVGTIDAILTTPGSMDVRGWAGDPDGDRTTQIRVRIDGTTVLQRTAALPRPDVPAVVAGVGPTTGYRLVLPARPGRHTVCIDAQNTGLAGLQNASHCTVAAVPDASAPGAHDPRGTFDTIRTTPSGGHLTYSAVGWAFDPDTGAPVNVLFRTFIDPFGIPLSSALQGATLATGVSRPDVQAAVPAAGPNAGFDGTIATTDQARLSYSCAYAVNTGPGADHFLGCKTTPL